MLLRGHNALRSSRALFRPPSLVRCFFNKSDTSNIRIPQPKKAKERRATRPWPSGRTGPGRSAARPIHRRDPGTTYTTVKIPNNSTAYIRWPTLKNFRSALQPRAYKTISIGGDETVDHYKELACFPYLYNDLGVMIFEGPDKNQVQIMGNIIRSVEREEGRLQDIDWATGNTYTVRYNKWNVYRIKLDPKKHVEAASLTDKLKGSITPTGLHDLTNIAFEKWKADGVGGPVPVEIVPGSKKMYILNHSQGPGLMNETISGLYLPQLHVYVATGIRGGTIYMSIEFHTVGTRRFVGVTYLRLRPTNQNPATAEEKIIGGRQADHYSEKRYFGHKVVNNPSPPPARDIGSIQTFYDKVAPSNTSRSSSISRAAMGKLFKLEQKLWSRRKKAIKKEKVDLARA